MSPFRALDDREVPDAVVDAVEAGTVAACIGDASRILEANDTYLDLTGYGREEMEAGDLSWLRLTPPELLAADARGIGEARTGGVSRMYEKAYLRRDGERVDIFIAILLLQAEPLKVFAVASRTDDPQGRALVEALAAP